MAKRLLMIFSVFAALSLMTVAAFAAQHETETETTIDDGNGVGQEAQGNYAVVRLEEHEGSGFHGIAVLREDANDVDDQTNDIGQNDVGQQDGVEQQDGIGQEDGLDQNGVGQVGAGQTEVVIALIGDNGGFLGFGGADEEQIGNAAILSGTCDEPGAIVHDLGDLQALHQQMQNGVGDQNGFGQEQQDQQQDMPELHVLATTVDMGLDELLTGQYILAVLEREDDMDQQNGVGQEQQQNGIGQEQQQNGVGQQQEEELNLIACGIMSEESRVQPATVTPEPVEPAEPIEPTPEPAPAF